MIRFLVAAQLRRARQAVLLILFIALTGVISSGLGSRMNTAMVSMFSVNVISTFGLFWSREMRVLPIIARDARTAAWMAVMTVPLLVLVIRLLWWTAGAIWGIWPDQQSPLESVLLRSTFEVLFFSANFTLADRSLEVYQPGKGLRTFASALLWAPWYFLPFAAPEVIPRSLGAFAWYNWVALAVMAGMAARPLFTDRDEWPRLGVIHEAGRLQSKAPPMPPVPIDTPIALPRNVKLPWWTRITVFLLLGGNTRHRLRDTATGFRRIVPGLLGSAAAQAAAASLFIAVVAYFSSKPLPPPMMADMSDGRFAFVSGLFVLMMIPPGFTSGLQPWLRRLRVLPVPTRTLVALNTIAPWRSLAFLWCFACLVHVARTWTAPETLRFDVLIAACGVASLTGSLMTRLRSHVTLMIAFTFPLLAFLVFELLSDRFDLAAIWRPEFLPVLGIVALLAAVAINHHTFTRSSSSARVYRADGEMAG